MGKTYRQMQRDIKEYRKQHPEFWCQVNVSYADLIKLHGRMQQLQQASVDTQQPDVSFEPNKPMQPQSLSIQFPIAACVPNVTQTLVIQFKF